MASKRRNTEGARNNVQKLCFALGLNTDHDIVLYTQPSSCVRVQVRDVLKPQEPKNVRKSRSSGAVSVSSGTTSEVWNFPLREPHRSEISELSHKSSEGPLF